MIISYLRTKKQQVRSKFQGDAVFRNRSSFSDSVLHSFLSSGFDSEKPRGLDFTKHHLSFPPKLYVLVRVTLFLAHAQRTMRTPRLPARFDKFTAFCTYID